MPTTHPHGTPAQRSIYRRVVVELLPQARKFLWIVTADLKGLHVPKGRRFVPLLESSPI